MELHTGDETLEERLVAEIGIMLLEVLLGGSHELDGDELVATMHQCPVVSSNDCRSSSSPSALKTLDDLADKATLH